jgi:hypothetical protein
MLFHLSLPKPGLVEDMTRPLGLDHRTATYPEIALKTHGKGFRMIWLTIIAVVLIAGPMGFWILGAGPAVMVILNVASLILTMRLYAVAADATDSRRSVFVLGLVSGLLGGAVDQTLLHLHSGANLATAFFQYASWGSMLYRLDILTRWWPFVNIVLGALGYSGLALLMAHLGRARRRLASVSRNVTKVGHSL